MNTLPPSDDEVARLLGSRLKRTSPEFEQRWRELRASFDEPNGATDARGRRWMLWPGLATATLATLAAVMVLRAPHRSGTPSTPTDFDEVLSLEAALAPATPLLDAESREVLLNLPVSTTR